MSNFNGVSVVSGVQKISVGALIALSLLAVLITVGGTVRHALKNPPPNQVQTVPVATTPDAGSFETLANPTPLPREISVDGGGGGAKTGKFGPRERREEFKARMDLLAMDVGIKYGDNVTVEKIYFAINNTEKADAAIVVLNAPKLKETTALLFIFNGTTWKTFPSDFQ